MAFYLLCVLSALAISCQASKYKVIVKTGDKFGAGTDANVYITLYGESGICGPKYLDSPANDFEQNSLGEYTVTCSSLKGNLAKIRIGQDNSGYKAGWYLSWVKVVNVELKQSYNFPCNRWLASDEGDRKISRLLKPESSYGVMVFTGTKSGAGTDANVRITLYGDFGVCGPKVLDNSDNNFESGKTDHFNINCPSLGAVKRIHIAHDNSGYRAGWYLNKVVVTDSVTSSEFTFPCNKWLATDEGDHHTWRDLNAA